LYNCFVNPQRILIIEDSKFYSTAVQKRIANLFGFETVAAYTYDEAAGILEVDTDFFLALVDLHLPGSEDGEVLDLVLERNVPAVVLTGDFDYDTREKIISSKIVVDYIFKQETEGFRVVMDVIKSLVRNSGTKVLVADDSKTQRARLRKILELQKFEVFEAGEGDTGFRTVEENPDIRLVLADYNMPLIDGFEMVKLIRRKYDRDRVAIIGMSGEDDGYLSARFLKTGANDFIKKPFETEELVARVNQNIEILDMLDRLKNLAARDPLTRLFNRRYFFDKGEKVFSESRTAEISLSLGILDIDYFKKVNDEFGHDAGDEFLKMLAKLLVENTRGADIVSRFGGEEFCIMALDTDMQGALLLFDKIREKIEGASLVYQGKAISTTASIGVASGHFFSLNDMIKHADQMLYHAKALGRNMVVQEPPE